MLAASSAAASGFSVVTWRSASITIDTSSESRSSSLLEDWPIWAAQGLVARSFPRKAAEERRPGEAALRHPAWRAVEPQQHSVAALRRSQPGSVCASDKLQRARGRPEERGRVLMEGQGGL